MRSKNILSAAAFVLAFALSAAFASLFITKTQTVSEYVPVSGHKSTSCFKDRNNSAAADKIAALIREDRSNGRDRDGKTFDVGEDLRPPFDSPKFPAYARAVEQYVNESSSMRTSDLPSDFQAEWREHMRAWRDYSEFLNRMKKPSNQSAWSDEELENTDDFHSREITRTWQAVLRTGRSHGADVY
jgi:hypothetical protein